MAEKTEVLKGGKAKQDLFFDAKLTIFNGQPLWPVGPPLRMKMGGPRHTTGMAGGVAILSFQTTVRQRFEHLAAKRDWRERGKAPR